LKQLLANNNNLKTLPSSIGELKQLEVLELKFNSLESLPIEISNCENLKFIYLNRNILKTLPEEMSQLSRLKELYLAEAGPLLEIPETFCDMRYLELLQVNQQIVVPTCMLVLKANRLKIISQ